MLISQLLVLFFFLIFSEEEKKQLLFNAYQEIGEKTVSFLNLAVKALSDECAI